MVLVKMTSTVWYGRPKRRYGPGDSVQVPEGLAQALGLMPVEEAKATPEARVSSTPRKRDEEAAESKPIPSPKKAT